MFRVTVRGPDGSETHYPLGPDQGLIVGRDDGSDIMLPSKRVSRRHARIYTTGQLLNIEDLGSQNGVFVGGARISGTQEIRPGPSIEIGEFKLSIKREDFTNPENQYAGVLEGFGAMEGRTLTLPAEKAIVGRDSSADLIIANDSVSRQHAELRYAGVQGWFVKDLGSSNGTFLNGTRMQPKSERALRPKDRVNFGDTGWYVAPKAVAESPVVARSRFRQFLVFVTMMLAAMVVVVYFILHPPHLSGEPGPGPHQPPPPEHSAWETCQQAIADKKWPEALRHCQDAYDEQPFIERRKALREAQFEMQEKAHFDDATRKGQIGGDLGAIEEFMKIETKSAFFPQARLQVQELSKPILRSWNNQCREAGRMHHWEHAIEPCEKYLRWTCPNGVDAGAVKVVADAQKAPKKSSPPFVCPPEMFPWFATGYETLDERKKFCERKYEDKDICDAIVAYVHKDKLKTDQAFGRAIKDPKTAEKARSLQDSAELVAGDYKKGTSTGEFREVERIFKEALEADAKLMPPGTESEYARDMNNRLADHYVQAAEEAKKNGWLDEAFKNYAAALPYRPTTEKSIAELEQQAEELLRGTPTCDNLGTALKYTREASQVHKDVQTKMTAIGCK